MQTASEIPVGIPVRIFGTAAGFTNFDQPNKMISQKAFAVRRNPTN